MPRSAWYRALVGAALLSRTLAAQVSPRQARVEIMIPKPPQPVVVEGRRTLVYELHVTNLGRGPLKLTTVDVFGDAGAAPLETYTDSAVLNPWSRTVVYLWVPLDPRQAIPATLRHRLTFDILDTADVRRDRGTQQTIDSILVAVVRAAPPVIRAPLDSGQWLAGDSPSNTSAHRRSLNALDGHGYISQRFAIDFVRIGPNGDVYHDDEHRNEDYWGFGQPVRAVAAGDVVEVLDSIPDNTPHAPLPPFLPRTISGNFVTLRIGPEQYATYAHLARGSVRVHAHQRVGPGDVIGLLGNSGQATGPHLHFQITDRPSVLASEGIPYVLDRFTFLGYAKDFEPAKHPSVPRQREIPGNDAVVALP